MIDPKNFVSYLEENFDIISGVPCSYFKEFLTTLTIKENELSLQHIYATREDEAIGVACGAAFSGKHSLVYMQNSGLGNIGDALTSLAQLYKLPMLILISYRGLESDRDFPEHSLMGELTEPMLKSLKLPYWTLTEDFWESTINLAIQEMIATKSPVALLVKKGVLSE
ncbi:MAG: sulfopyruvate decarboxylase subunit alpha [Asgard group archaeon]|nr:sulfopyruvate decarboxylase subunit alpha [Asgard group archaeon]